MVFDKLKGMFGGAVAEPLSQVTDLGKEISEGLTAMMNEDLSTEQVSKIGEKLGAAATTAKGLLEQLPDSQIKTTLGHGLGMLMDLNPSVEGQPVTMKEASSITDWVQGLYEALTRGGPIVERVKAIINSFSALR